MTGSTRFPSGTGSKPHSEGLLGNFSPVGTVTVMEQAARPSPFCDQGQRGRPGRVVTGVEKSVPQDGS